MKLSSLFVSLIAIGCAGIAGAEDTCKVQFLDSISQKPLAAKTFQFVPRRILLRAPQGTPDPNLKFAESFTTDADGGLSMTTTVLNRLTSDGRIIVDVHCPSHARFSLKRAYNPPGLPIFSITTFSATSGQVAAAFQLTFKERNLIKLEPTPP